jgi:hypothetical protein
MLRLSAFCLSAFLSTAYRNDSDGEAPTKKGEEVNLTVAVGGMFLSGNVGALSLPALVGLYATSAGKGTLRYGMLIASGSVMLTLLCVYFFPNCLKSQSVLRRASIATYHQRNKSGKFAGSSPKNKPSNNTESPMVESTTATSTTNTQASSDNATNNTTSNNNSTNNNSTASDSSSISNTPDTSSTDHSSSSALSTQAVVSVSVDTPLASTSFSTSVSVSSSS